MFDTFLDGLPEDRRDALRSVIRLVQQVVPEATEGRSYGLPAFRYRDKPLLGFSSTEQHLSLYPFSPDVIEAVRPRLEGYSLSKGTIRFTPDRPVPDDVLEDVVRGRMEEIDPA